MCMNKRYACSLCSEHFTRHFNAKRHTLRIHDGAGEIVPWVAGAGAGVSTATTNSNHTPRRRKSTSPPIVADSMGDFSGRFGGAQGQPQPQTQQQQQQPQQNNLSQYLAFRDQMLSQPQPQQQQSQTQQQSVGPDQPNPIPSQSQINSTMTTGTTKNSWGITSETLLKLAELKSLVYRYADIFPNFEIIYEGAKHFAIAGDTSFLDEKLAYFKSLAFFNGIRNGSSSGNGGLWFEPIPTTASAR